MELAEVDRAEQRRQILELLREGFGQAKFDWSVAFDTLACHGLLMIADGSPQGCMLFFEKTETIDGHARRIVNFSSFYIRPKYRRFAVRMVRALSSDPDTIYTAVTAIRSTQAIARRVGYRHASHGSAASVPLLNGFLSPRDIHIEPFDPAAVEPEHGRWVTDHADARHIAVMIRKGERVVPVLWKRGLRVKELPAVRLMFAPDYALLRAALPALHVYMLRRHGMVGLYLPKVGPLEGLRSLRKPNKGPSLMVKGDIADADVNLLYTELHYLPL